MYWHIIYLSPSVKNKTKRIYYYWCEYTLKVLSEKIRDGSSMYILTGIEYTGKRKADALWKVSHYTPVYFVCISAMN